MRKLRKHQPIWEAIKKSKDNTTSLLAPIELHKRIIKAVINEKSRDSAWKLECSIAGTMYKLAYKVDGKMITFNLIVDKSIRNL